MHVILAVIRELCVLFYFYSPQQLLASKDQSLYLRHMLLPQVKIIIFIYLELTHIP